MSDDDRSPGDDLPPDDGRSPDDDLPDETVEAATRLTRLARGAVDEDEAAAYRADRDERLAARGFSARERERDETLVLYPQEWLADGTVQLDRVQDTGRAVEVPLSGAGDPDDWDAVESHNAAMVDRVAAEHGPVHAANARAFADFMGNHYARRVETATAAEVREFLEEYYPRNAWPDDDQRDAIETSLGHLFALADRELPLSGS